MTIHVSHTIATPSPGDSPLRRRVTAGHIRNPAAPHVRHDPPSLAAGWRLPNLWDAVAFLCVFGALIAVDHVARGTLARIDAPGATEVSLDPINLPEYAVRTTLRMFAALAASLLFTFTYGTAAAKSRRAGLVLIPMLDVLQSVPILGFLTFTVVFFMNLFPGQVMGLELAAIFAIFTSQAWNMAFSLYQSLKTVPADLMEAAISFHLTAWQRFWRLEVPFATPGPGVEHHDVDVRRLVLRRRVRGGVGRRQHLEAARHRLLCRSGAGAAGHRRGGLGDPGHAGGDPGLRPVAVPPAGRLVGQVPLRDDGRRHRLRPLDAAR